MGLLIIMVIVLAGTIFMGYKSIFLSKEVGLVPVRSDHPPNTRWKKDYQG